MNAGLPAERSNSSAIAFSNSSLTDTLNIDSVCSLSNVVHVLDVVGGVSSAGGAGVGGAAVLGVFVPPPLPPPPIPPYPSSLYLPPVSFTSPPTLFSVSSVEAREVKQEQEVKKAEAKENGKDVRTESEEKERKKRPLQVPGSVQVELPESAVLGPGLSMLSHAPPAATPVTPCVPVSVSSPQVPDVARLNIKLYDICKLSTPMVKRVPNNQRSAFATEWGRLLKQALDEESEVSWSEFFTFPRCMLWSPKRGGRRLTRRQKFHEVVRARLVKWQKGGRADLWKSVVERSTRQLADQQAPQKPRDGKKLEATVISALRMGDVKKALQLLNSAPLAPATEETFQRLKDLHPQGPLPDALPKIKAEDIPIFTDDLVRSALSTFGPGSAAGLFGIKPVLLQQATRAETYYFGSTLTRACNYFAQGMGPEFLRPLMAGGVSIALEKSATAVRPLACGDPIRRLVGKLFCLGGKEEISKAFEGKNYGVGCKGGVEVVAHSLRML
jgi:hypothetical protein